MLATGGVILTTAGSLLISRSLELVKPIEFTHMKIGTGDINSIAQARKLNDLVASYKNINMSTLVRSGDLVRVRGSFTNDEITETVRIKEVGVFAKIGTEQPILFGYVNDGEGELIPPGTSGVIARTRDLYIGVTGEAEVAITINKSLVYATIEDLEKGLNRKEDKFIKRSGWNLEKTDLTENDSNKVFTPKGALNLFNTLTTNFTNGINAAKEVLRLDIVKKLNKGAYLGDAQDLKNEIDTKLPTNEAYKNYVKDGHIGDTDTPVDSTVISGKYQCGANSGKYHLSYLSVIDLFSNHKRQIHHDYENGIQWRDKYNGNFSGVPWNTLWDSLNSPKSHVTENRGDKIFTPLGALNLKNWLVENYTTLMTNTRDTLTNLINTKTPHGGYDKTSQDLKNDIDGKLPIRSLSSVISTREWSQLLKIREGTFKLVITYGRNSVVAKGIFLVTIGHNDKANIITLGTHNYSNANFCLRIRTYNNYGFIEMLDIAPNLDSYDTQVISMDIYDVSHNNIFETFSSYTPVKTDGIIACNVRTNHGSMYFNEHRVLHLGDFNPDSKFDRKKIFDAGVPKTFTGACQVKDGSPDYGYVGGGSQHFLIQMSTEDQNESNAYVGQIAFGYSPDNPKIAIRCKTPSKNGAFVELLTKNSIDGLYCPYRVGDIISSTNQANPAATWIGTTWEKLENCFLYGHNTVGARGGTSQINLTVAQLPPHNMGSNYLRRVGGDGSWDYRPSVSVHPDDAGYYNSDTIGLGHAIGIMPPYYTVFMWRRTS